MGRIILLQILAAVIGAVIAAKKGRNGLLWGLLCFSFPILVIVVTLLPPVRTRTAVRRCPSCYREMREDEVICRFCKRESPIELVQCRECGSFVPEREFCSQCSRRLKP